MNERPKNPINNRPIRVGGVKIRHTDLYKYADELLGQPAWKGKEEAVVEETTVVITPDKTWDHVLVKIRVIATGEVVTTKLY